MVAPADHIHVVLVLSGRVTLEVGQRKCVVDAPGLFLRDFAATSVATTDDVECITIYCARDFIEGAGRIIIAQGGLAWSPDASILRDLVRAIGDQIGWIELARAGFYARLLRDLIALVCASMLSDGAPGQSDIRARAIAMMSGSKASISAAELARNLGVSRSALYRAFERDGGVLAHDSARRLRAIYHRLLDATERRWAPSTVTPTHPRWLALSVRCSGLHRRK